LVPYTAARGLLDRRKVIDEAEIAAVISRATGIPVNRLTESERERLGDLEGELHARVIGQDDAVTAVAKAVRRSRTGMGDARRPVGSFLFLGPTGVGKTELARALASSLFDDEQAIVRFDMSEFGERHTVSRLVGAPPGYVGYDEAGQLTERVRRNPYSIVLFDEIEKAHPDVFNLLLQILDDGRLTDSQGRIVDFRNTVIIMTSNIGSQIIVGAGAVSGEGWERVEQRVRDELSNHFRPEFLNRVDDVIVFRPLSREDLAQIVDIQLRRLEQTLAERHLHLEVTPEARELLATQGYDPVYGARPLKRVIQRELQNAIALELLEGRFGEGETIRVERQGDHIRVVPVVAVPEMASA
jgi:ATP-dependent Clp protease ATP-binding subunit ClpC